MSVNEIEVILDAFKELKKDMKGDIAELRREIKEGLDTKCDSCQHVPTFRERFKGHWAHIAALWTAVVGLGGGFLWLARQDYENFKILSDMIHAAK